MAIIIILVIVLIAVFHYLKSRKNRPVPGISQPESKSGVGKHVREIKRIDLKGVSNYINSNNWNNINSFDIVNIKFDTSNTYDKNAIGAYTPDGKLLGYLPRNQRKIIKTLRENETCLAMIVSKIRKKPLKHSKYENIYSIRIDLWLGFSKDELEQEKTKRLDSEY